MLRSHSEPRDWTVEATLHTAKLNQISTSVRTFFTITNCELAAVRKQELYTQLFTPQLLHCMPSFQRVQRSKTSCAKTNSVDSVLYVFSCLFFVCFFVRKFALLAKMCSVTELCMLPSLVHVLTVWDVANGKRGLKRRCILCRTRKAFSFVHIQEQTCIYSLQRPSGGSSLKLSALLHVVEVSRIKSVAPPVYSTVLFYLTFFWALFPLFSSTLVLTLSQRGWH